MLSHRLIASGIAARTASAVAPSVRNTSARLFSCTAASMAKISEVIKHDHQELEEFYNSILKAKTNEDKVKWQNQFTWELARHSIGEELVVYPAMERALEDGKSMADKDREEHTEVKQKLYKFQSLKPEDADFEPTLKSLWKTLIEHIKEEEEIDLPKLEDALTLVKGADDSTESESLAASFQRTKKFVPTRSHPSAPDQPPYETVVGLMAAPIDKLGDLFRKFPKDS